MARHLIVNADDFGLSDEVNAGVVHAHDHGIVTSASLMVRWPAAPAAAALAAERPRLALGIHVDLGEWEPSPDGGWAERYAVVDVDDADAVAGEVDRQLAEFARLTGTTPTHVDGHQHVQRSEPVRTALRAVAGKLGVALRFEHPQVTYRGDFYGQGARGEAWPRGIGVANLVEVVSTLPDGWTEVACHPGINVPPSASPYAAERGVEVQALCDPAVVAALARHDVILASFADLARDGDMGR